MSIILAIKLNNAQYNLDKWDACLYNQVSSSQNNQ